MILVYLNRKVVRRFMAEHEMVVRDVAERADVNESTAWRWISGGRVPERRVETLRQIFDDAPGLFEIAVRPARAQEGGGRG